MAGRSQLRRPSARSRNVQQSTAVCSTSAAAVVFSFAPSSLLDTSLASLVPPTSLSRDFSCDRRLISSSTVLLSLGGGVLRWAGEKGAGVFRRRHCLTPAGDCRRRVCRRHEKKRKTTTGEFYLCCEVAAVTCQCDISRSLFLPLSVYLVPRGLNSG